MARDLSVRPLLEDHAWRVAIIGGVAALPFTIALYAQTGDLFIAPVFFGGVIAGYLYREGPTERSQVATRVGVIGALPLPWSVIDTLLYPIFEMGAPTWMLASATAFVAVVIPLGFGVAALVAMGGAWVGDWLNEKVSPIRPVTKPH